MKTQSQTHDNLTTSALFHDNSDALFVIHLGEGRILDANPAALRVTSFDRAEVCALRMYDVFVSTHGHGIQQLLEGFSNPSSFRAFEEFCLRRKHGPPLPININVSQLQTTPEPLGLVTARDIGARLRADAEQRQNEERAAQIQRNESLAVMACGIAHDFNNLLTVILGNTLLVKSEIDPQSALVQQLDNVAAAGHSAATLCHHLLAYVGKQNMCIQVVHLNELVGDLDRALHSLLQNKTDFRMALAEPAIVIQADPAYLRQALLSVAANAVEAMGEQTVPIEITTGVVSCTRQVLDQIVLGDRLPEGQFAFVEIADSGQGMDAATRARIFEPFFSSRSPGRGMGLAVVYGIMRGHRGAVQVTSEPGHGTRIRLIFPLADASGNAPPAVPEAQTSVNAGTILVVEEEPNIRALVCKILGTRGYGCFVAADGAEALRVYRERIEQIDLVLMDLTMPRLGGEATFHELRAINPKVRVILCTGFDADNSATRLRTQGICDIVQKPFTPQILLERIAAALAASPTS